MPTVRLTLNGQKQLTQSLANISKYTNTTAPRLAKALGREGVKIAKKLTPRQRRRNRSQFSQRGFPALHTQWYVIEGVLQQKQHVIAIKNRAANNPEGLTILASLEGGAAPHTIMGNPYLAWDQPQTVSLFGGRSFGQPNPGDVADTFTGSSRRGGRITLGRMVPFIPGRVNHPGHEAFHTIEETRNQLERIAQAYIRQMRMQLVQAGTGLNINSPIP